MSSPKNADARKYYRTGFQRLEEAELIFKKVGLSAAAVYLAGYSVECMMKALLIAGCADKDRSALLIMLKKDFGHSVHRLIAGMTDRRVQIPSSVVRSLTLVSSWSPDLRYEPGPGDPIEAARFLKEARSIVLWADRSI